MKWENYNPRKKSAKPKKSPPKENERQLVRWPCVERFRTWRDLGLLKKYDFVYAIIPPDPRKIKPHHVKYLIKDGYEKGVFDMTIIASSKGVVKVWLIEFKFEKAKYTKEQAAIASNAEQTDVKTLIIRSVDEFDAFLVENLR